MTAVSQPFVSVYVFSNRAAIPFISFFFNDTATTEIYTVMNTLSLHDALPISKLKTGLDSHGLLPDNLLLLTPFAIVTSNALDRKSTRLNQSLITISYAVF